MRLILALLCIGLCGCSDKKVTICSYCDKEPEMVGSDIIYTVTINSFKKMNLCFECYSNHLTYHGVCVNPDPGEPSIKGICPICYKHDKKWANEGLKTLLDFRDNE